MQAQYKKTGKSCVKVVYKTFQMPFNPSEIKGLRHIYAKTLDFTLFFDHFVFTPNAENVLEKEIKKEIPVSAGIELVVVDMSENVDFMG